jgi:plasmid maintenance system antidote protein VapI
MLGPLKAAVENSSESQNAIAQSCGIDQGNLNAFMHGRRSISLETALAVRRPWEVPIYGNPTPRGIWPVR